MIKFQKRDYPKHITKLASRIADDLNLLSENLQAVTCGDEVYPCEPVNAKLVRDKLVVTMLSGDGKKRLLTWTLPSDCFEFGPN